MPGSVLLLGELLVDMLGEGGGSLEEATLFRPLPGGAPGNAAVAAARAGVPTSFVGTVGRDGFGRLLRATLTRAGVDCARVREHPRLATTLAFVMPKARGDLGFQFNRGADAALAPADLGPEVLDGVAALGCGGVSLSAQPSRDATLAALGMSRGRVPWTVFDVNWRPALWEGAEVALPVIRQAIAATRVVKCNESELALVMGERGSEAERARALLELGPEVAVVTLGERGALWVSREVEVQSPGHTVDSVDAIGAGDCFTGNLLARLARHGAEAAPPAEAAREILAWCNAAAALSTTRAGAMGAMPSADEVARFLARV